MEELPSNSQLRKPKDRDESRDKAEPIKVEKVVVGRVIQRKKPWRRRFVESFTGGEDSASVFEYVLHDVVIPAGKDLLADALFQGVERKLGLDSRPRGTRRRGYGGGYEHTPYDRMYRGDRDRREDPRDRDRSERRLRRSHDIGEIVVASRAEANGVLDGLEEIITRYGVAPVTALYDLLGESSNFTDENWGWTEIRGSRVRRVSDGYLIELPRPEPID